MEVINQYLQFSKMNNQEDKDSPSRTRMCGTLMPRIEKDKMKNEQNKLSDSSEMKMAEL